MPYMYELRCELPATPREVYDTWLSSEGHSQMTGAPAEMSDVVGAKVSAWDGYITGANVALTPGERIDQSWRSGEFVADDEDSLIELTLAPAAEGCLLTLRHSRVPDGQTGYERSGWQEFYFKPMRAYFQARRDAAHG
jgi:activator of HSP90 ATPase